MTNLKFQEERKFKPVYHYHSNGLTMMTRPNLVNSNKEHGSALHTQHQEMLPMNLTSIKCIKQGINYPFTNSLSYKIVRRTLKPLLKTLNSMI